MKFWQYMTLYEKIGAVMLFCFNYNIEITEEDARRIVDLIDLKY